MKQFLDSYYYVTEEGQIWSNYSKKFLSQGKNNAGYKTVGIIVNGIKYTMVHRIVAIAYHGLQEGKIVDHEDKDRENNYYKNLRWLTQQDNVHRSYEELSPIRNHIKCQLLYKGEVIEECESIIEASRIFASKYGGSKTSMDKYRKVGDYEIKKV